MTRTPRTDEELAELLRTNIIVTETGCHEWQGYRSPKGYGAINHNRKLLRTHRLAWTFAHGPIPPGLMVMHLCDNPPCVNIEHLRLGTAADNMRDMIEKGRGDRVPPAIRHERERVAELRSMSFSMAEVATMAAVARSTVLRWIRSGRLRAILVGKTETWRILPEDLLPFLAKWERHRRRNAA